MKETPCRSCGSPVIWARTERGRKIPLDPQPIKMGNLRLVESLLPDDPPTAIADAPDEDYGYLAHFATCPHAARWRRRKQPTNTGGPT